MRLKRLAREDLKVWADRLAQVLGGRIGVCPGLQLDRGEIDDVQASLRKEPGKICGACKHHPEPHEPRTEHILTADRNLAVADLDDPANVERPEHRAG